MFYLFIYFSSKFYLQHRPQTYYSKTEGCMLCWLSQPDAPVLSFSSFFSTSRVITLFYLFSFSCCKYLFSTFRSLIHLEFTFSAGGSDLVFFVFPLRKVNFKNMIYYICFPHMISTCPIPNIHNYTRLCSEKFSLDQKEFQLWSWAS